MLTADNTGVLHNFSPGPALLPAAVLEQAAVGIADFCGAGLSLLELSHRSEAYRRLQGEAMERWLRLYAVPEGYDVLFLQGGASTQFAMVPLNLLGAGDSADYVSTGRWSEKAIDEAAAVGVRHRVAASSADRNHSYIPRADQLDLDTAARYLHITSNNTIFGTQYPESPAVGTAPLVIDASSDLLSRPIAWERIGLLYGGAQKNAGISGLTVVCIRRDLISCRGSGVPTMMRYDTHAAADSLYNTPPTFAVLVLDLTMRWIEEQGGLAMVDAANRHKASLLYEVIDGDGFYEGHAEPAARSLMNVVFRIPADRALEPEFVSRAGEEGLIGLEGHRAAGGLRASIYNAMSVEGCRGLAEFMVAFRGRFG